MEHSLSAGEPTVNVGETERVLSAFAGSLLMGYIVKKHKIDSLLLVGGGYLLYRALSGHCPVKSVLQNRAQARHATNINIRTHVIVNRPRDQVYAFWRDLENLPLFMHHIESVDEIDERVSAWKVKLPGGMGDIRWQAALAKEEKNAELSWHSTPDASIENTGKINFSDTPGNGTRVDVMISYRAPLGIAGERLSRLLTPTFRQLVEEDVHRFKNYFENFDRLGVAGD